MQETAALRYSHALFESGKEINRLDIFLSQMKDITAVFHEHKELIEFLNHPNVKANEKKKVLDEIFKGTDQEILKLLMLLVEHGRINEISMVYKDLRNAVYNYKGIVMANAITAVPMNTDEIETLREKLSLKHGKKFEIENVIDQEVLGGVYLKIGDEVIDGSVRGQLERMKKELFNT
jgi:F-type H+-transporting ATPase subunit delta